MDEMKVVPILEGYDELGELIEQAVRLKRVSKEITWYMHRIEQRITTLMTPVPHDYTQNNAWMVRRDTSQGK